MPLIPPTAIATSEVRPIPDPTVLTTQQLLREIATSREVVEATANGFREVTATRFTSIESTLQMMQIEIEKRPPVIAEAVHKLELLHSEKFKSIATQFLERDTRTEVTSRDSKVAVDAALQAAKEAVSEQNKSNALANSKMEAAFTKQIDQIAILIGTMQKSSDDKIDDLKTRLLTIEGAKKGTDNVWAFVIGVGGLLIAGAAIFFRHN